MERRAAIHPHDPCSARARVHDWRQQAGSRRRSSDNKYRFSDSEDYLESLLIVRSGLKAPLARSQMLRARTRLALAERLPTSTKRRARHALSLMTPWRRST